MVTLCRAAIFPDWPVPIVPLGLFCHSGPVLDQILSSESYVSGSEVTSAIFRQARSLYSSAAYIGIATPFRASHVPCKVTAFTLWLFPMPTKNSEWNVLRNWSIAEIYVNPLIPRSNACDPVNHPQTKSLNPPLRSGWIRNSP